MWWRGLLALLIAVPLAAVQVPSARTSGAVAASARQMGYGILAIHSEAIASMGFTTTKIFATWKDLEPSRGNYSSGAFQYLDDQVNGARGQGLSVLLTVQKSPSWASGSSYETAPPINENDFANFMSYLASRFRGRVIGYEIWNEPNLRIEWGMEQPDPVKYASMLRALYPRVKAADPSAQVITGGLSTAGDGIGYWNYGDLLWIANLYQQGNVKSCSDGQGGLRSCFDALGSHPYGGPFAPETQREVAQYTVGMYFRRAEQQKDMMNIHGQDYDRGVWATEFGWLIDPAAFGVSCAWGSGWDSYKLTGTASQQEATQADYLVRAYDYAYSNWPWMEQMIAFNLDYPGSGQCDQIAWYSLTRPDGSLRPAYYALAGMAKPGIVNPALALSANRVVFLMDPAGPSVSSRTFQVTNSATASSLAWTAAEQASWLTLGGSSGTTPGSMTITANRRGLPNGTYTATVSVGSSGAQNSPQYIQVQLYVGPVYREQLSPARKDS